MEEDEGRKEEPSISMATQPASAGGELSARPGEIKRTDQTAATSSPALKEMTSKEVDLKKNSQTGTSEQGAAAITAPSPLDKGESGWVAGNGDGLTKRDQLAVSESATADSAAPSKGGVVIPAVPENSIGFQSDWKRLKKNPDALSRYFKVKCLP